MTLKQAFTQWAVAPRNTVLAAKSREPVQRVLMKQWGDIDLENISETFARRIFRESKESLEFQVKAASILVYVLQWGGDQGHCQRPTFSYDIASDEWHKAHDEQPKQERTPMPQTLAELSGRTVADDNDDPLKGVDFPDTDEKPETKSEPKQKSDMKQEKKRPGKPPRPVAQIDAETLQVIKEWPSMGEAERELGCCNIDRCIKLIRKSGGFYWSNAADADTFADRLKEKQSNAQKPAAKPKAQPKPKTEKKPLHGKEAEEAVRKAVLDTMPPAPKYHNGDLVISTEKELRGRMGIVVSEGWNVGGVYMYEVRYGTEQWKIREPDLSPFDGKLEVIMPVRRTFDVESIVKFTDQELIDELTRRGWEGELSRRQSVIVGRGK